MHSAADRMPNRLIVMPACTVTLGGGLFALVREWCAREWDSSHDKPNKSAFHACAKGTRVHSCYLSAASKRSRSVEPAHELSAADSRCWRPVLPARHTTAPGARRPGNACPTENDPPVSRHNACPPKALHQVLRDGGQCSSHRKARAENDPPVSRRRLCLLVVGCCVAVARQRACESGARRVAAQAGVAVVGGGLVCVCRGVCGPAPRRWLSRPARELHHRCGQPTLCRLSPTIHTERSTGGRRQAGEARRRTSGGDPGPRSSAASRALARPSGRSTGGGARWTPRMRPI
jgi:hypothetical protein